MSLFADFAPEAHGAPLDGVTLRRAAAGDEGALGEFTARREGKDASELSARFATEIASLQDDNRLWVAVHAGLPIAFGRARRYECHADAAQDHVPAGWYLGGVIVEEAWRRRGIARALTAHRIEWIGERAREVYYVANRRNRASLELHAAFGFMKLNRSFTLPGVLFQGGDGGLYRLDLARKGASHYRRD